MRKYTGLCVITAIILIAIPLLAVGGEKKQPPPKPVQSTSPKDEDHPLKTDGDNFKVLLSASGEVITLNEAEYVFGAVAAEMPAEYDIQALKAQAVACYTYAYTKRLNERASPSPELKGADISDSPQTHQGYIDNAAAKEKWGDKYEDYHAKLTQAVSDVLGQIIVCNGKPILAAYHCISAGQTESAKELWGEDIPYLASVKSPGDLLSPEFKTTAEFSKDEFKEKAQTLEGVEITGEDASEWAEITETSQADTVLNVKIGSGNASGLAVRDAFNLRSPCFTLKYKDGKFIFTVSGYGHGVGMSQYGADYMARQGSTYVEILKHYYTGAEIILKNEIK